MPAVLSLLLISDQPFGPAISVANHGGRTALATLPAEIEKIDACQEFKSADELKSCLDLYFKLHTDINKCTLYSNMTVDTEPSAETKSGQQEATAVLNKFMEHAQGVRKGILKLDPKTLDKFFAENEALKRDEPYIRNIFRRKDRVLSDDAERVLGLAGDNLWA